MYSKTHLPCFSLSTAMAISDLIPYSFVMVTISPGITSRTNSPPMVSMAQVSEDNIYELSNLPIDNGLNP